jgi:hypothetical protein
MVAVDGVRTDTHGAGTHRATSCPAFFLLQHGALRTVYIQFFLRVMFSIGYLALGARVESVRWVMFSVLFAQATMFSIRRWELTAELISLFN